MGNPLSKDFLHFIEEDRLVSDPKEAALTVAKVSRQCAYWKISHERIEEQMVVWLQNNQGPEGAILPQGHVGAVLPQGQTGAILPQGRVGAILPQVVPAGTVTRRAVERTWMTASNAYPDRIGSDKRR